MGSGKGYQILVLPTELLQRLRSQHQHLPTRGSLRIQLLNCSCHPKGFTHSLIRLVSAIAPLLSRTIRYDPVYTL